MMTLINFSSSFCNSLILQVRINEESLLLDNNIAGLSDSDDDNILL